MTATPSRLLPGLIASLALITPTLNAAAQLPEQRPNIIYILADDMGLGDVSAYNPQSAWRTPHLDQLAREGVKFTDAHSSSAVCTPSRYSLLTGRYAWRSRLKSRVLFGYSPPLIEPGRLTVPALLRQHGYRTAMIGKWHLGIDWARQPADTPPADYEAPVGPGPRAPENDPQLARHMDYGSPFRNGPLSIGFDSFFGISASLDMDPYVWLRDDRVEAPPMRRVEASKPPAMWRAGPIAENFAHGDVQTRLTTEAVAFLREQESDKPFFLYLAYASPHTPILPSKDFAGRTGSPYGDFCLQLDHDVGEIMRALESRGLSDNTLIIFTADNGCSPMANFAQLKTLGHNPNFGLRGAKADIFEGGHRVPFIARWPREIPAGTTSHALVAQQDLLATCAELLSAELPSDAGEDSVSHLALLRDPADHRLGRASLVNHSVLGAFALRRGPWKLCATPDSGGWSDPKPGQASPDAPPFQLFNLEVDRAETTNLYSAEPALVNELALELREQILRGRSTPGANQSNTGGDEWPELSWMKHLPQPAASSSVE